MARVIDNDASAIFAAADEWREQCLIGGQSLFWEGLAIWGLPNLHRFKTCFIDNLDES
jgi:hypothetical protein